MTAAEPGRARSARSALRAVPAVLAILTQNVLSLGCAPGEPGASGVEARTYEVRGVVRRLPEAGEADSPIWIHHEAIPGFVDVRGRVVGMEAMSMPFPVDAELDLAGIEPGDKIAFRLAVDWEGAKPARITALERLPPSTRLAFETAPSTKTGD